MSFTSLKNFDATMYDKSSSNFDRIIGWIRIYTRVIGLLKLGSVGIETSKMSMHRHAV